MNNLPVQSQQQKHYKRCHIYSKLKSFWCFIANFEHNPNIFLVNLLSTLNRKMLIESRLRFQDDSKILHGYKATLTKPRLIQE